MFVASLKDCSDGYSYGTVMCNSNVTVEEFQSKINEIKNSDLIPVDEWTIEDVFEAIRNTTDWDFEDIETGDELYI